MLPISSLKTTYCLLPALILGLTGCGLTQSVTQGTTSTVKSIFYKKIITLHLDFTAREALNTDSTENNSLSEPVMVRVYQLQDRKTFDKALYQQLLNEGDTVLGSDLLARRDVVLKPGGDVLLDMPMEPGTTFVAIVGLFRHPDMATNSWKQVLALDELDPDKPRVIEAGHNSLTLRAEAQ
ncbi:type VI secretion system lipoprotein TssJ [Nissabacter sp. SGAir0207]|uniref:type VI secretion system lipoprotein TssJ n=1 Tax=Nissabacter sp. SGAir0207 TaxID=2126321 RepID=UPI0010CCE2AD|nr:type VI secretion system lipoprotein TssJ [Nissabacter sp. SGAir0207]QCR36018.1 type VI secretion system lipoprotein TssJ [Nissabacter sp. SGAir0207]